MRNIIRKTLQPSIQYLKKIFLSKSCPSFLQFAIFKFKYYRRGISILKSLHNRYGSNFVLNICPYKGTGDVYLAAAYFKDSKFDKEGNIFCVIGSSNKKISELFQLKAIILQFTQKEIDSLTRLSFFLGLKEANVNILHHSPLNWHGGINDRFRNINGLNFTDLIGYGAFNVKDSKRLAKPYFLENDEQTESMFGVGKLKKGKTVLLSPYAYTFRNNLPIWCWTKIAKILISHGYSVCTNVGAAHEEPIEGTVGIKLEYKQLKAFLNTAGYFVGIRSGFCDVISSIDCKKIIIYQPFRYGESKSPFDYFGLNKTGLCTDAIEISYDSWQDYYNIIDSVIDSIMREEKN